MLGSAIRTFGSWVYQYPEIRQDTPAKGPFARLRVALVADYFTAACLAYECKVRYLHPGNYRDVIDQWRPDVLFVESAFHGVDGAWRYRLADEPAWLRLGPPTAILRVVDHARQQGIPTVFWNKDDGAFFKPFIRLAGEFDYVFTTDDTCLAAYRRHLPEHVPVGVLSMPYQPAFHSFDGFAFQERAASFTGSYYRKILHERARFLDMVFDAAGQVAMPTHVYDRNSNRISRWAEFRFPRQEHLHIHPRIPHEDTARVYKHYAASINVNSVTDSATMCSRRLLEILACGGIAITNPSLAVEKCFGPFCHVVEHPGQARALFQRLHRDGPSSQDLERAHAGAIYVKQHHTWQHRLAQLADVVNF